ncbi:transcriptional regulator LysR family [Vibrio ponticus]|nr:transcriptional regulator LysR family [Vibrio ponticus]
MRHLKAFYVFHVAANSESYTDAAEKLNLTHGAVSKQIKTLEEYLSQSLFFKSGRNVVLTKQGKTLARYTSAAFTELERGVDTLTKTQQYLEVSSEPTLTMRWLMSRITEFNEQHKTDVRLSTSGGPVTLGSTTGLSLAIRVMISSLMRIM